MQYNIILPDLGQTTSEARISRWLKKPGDRVLRGEAVIVVETDKVDMEVEAFESGYIREFLVPEGSMAKALEPVAILTETADESYDAAGTNGGKPDATESTRQSAVPIVNGSRSPGAAPAARALAKDLGVNLADVEGTGPKGLITSADVQRFAETLPSAGAPDRKRALAAMAATTAASKRDVPHFYVTRDLEVSAAARWRDRWNQSHGAHASFNDVFVWCAARALGDVPRMNLAYRDGVFEQRTAADLQLVVAREQALQLVPVADPRALNWEQFVERMHHAAAAMQAPKFAPLLAISNLGMHGVKEFSAIIPPGCSSVLAIGAVREASVVRDGALTVARIATGTLSADHRVIDGITAARFLERMQFHLDSL